MTESERKKREYEWYKSIGICVICHKVKAEPGHTQCLACMMARREKGDTHSKESKERHKEYLKKRRRENLKKGICVVCGKHKAMPGKTYCEFCKAKSRLREEKKRRELGIMPRAIMGTGNFCYFCGKPTNGKKICAECYEKCKNKMLYARSFKREKNYFEKQCKNNFVLTHII